MSTETTNRFQIELDDIDHVLACPSLSEWGHYNGRDVTLRRVQLNGNVSATSTTVEDEVMRVTMEWQRTLNLDHNDYVNYFVADENEVYFLREGMPLFAYFQQLSDEERQHQMWPRFREVAVALMNLHDRDVVHGTLESSSVLFYGDQAKLDVMMPVPIATMIEFKTSPGWCAPELKASNQGGKRLPTKASDIFALGLCIIHALSGTLPLVNKLNGAIVLPESISCRQEHQLLLAMCNRVQTSRPNVHEVVRRITRFCDCQYLLELTRSHLEPDDLTDLLVNRLKKFQKSTCNSSKCVNLLAAVVDFVSSPVMHSKASSVKSAIAYSQFHNRLDFLMMEPESCTSWLKALRKEYTNLDDPTISAIRLIPWKYRHMFLSGIFDWPTPSKPTYDSRDVEIHLLPHISPHQIGSAWKAYKRWKKLRHPNVVEFIGFCKAPNHLNGSSSTPEPSPGKPINACGVVWEAFDGKTLIDHVRETIDITYDEIRELLRQAAVGLAMLHAHDLVHGNISTKCFLYANGIVKLRADRVSPVKIIKTSNISNSMADEVFRFGVFMLAVVLRENSIQDGDALSFLYDERIVVSGIQDLVRRTCAHSPSDRPTMKILIDCLSLKGELVSTLRETTNDFEYNGLDRAVVGRISILRDCIDGLIDDEIKQRFAAIQRRFDQCLYTKETIITSLPSVNSRLTHIGKVFFSHCSHNGLVGIDEDLDSLAPLVRQALNDRSGDGSRFVWESISLNTHCDLLLDEVEAVLQNEDEDVHREIATWCCYEFNRNPNQFSADQKARLSKMYARVHEGVDIRSVRLPEWFVPSYFVDLHEQIGEGAFGTVHRAKWQGSTVAVKLVVNAKEVESTADMIREADIWFPLRHPRVSRMLGGFHFSQCFLLSEYEQHGSLNLYLESKNDVPSDVKKIAIWKLLYDAAMGLSYLHERGIAHGDLRGDNILVGSDGRAKIGDMGLSFMVAAEENQRVALGAWAWKAPERHEKYNCVLPDGHSLMSDVYALGMCIIEAFTGNPPYSQGKHPLPDSTIRFYLKRCIPPDLPDIFSPEESDLLNGMCNFSPAERLKIHQVVQRLEGFAYPGNDATVAAIGKISNVCIGVR